MKDRTMGCSGLQPGSERVALESVITEDVRDITEDVRDIIGYVRYITEDVRCASV